MHAALEDLRAALHLPATFGDADPPGLAAAAAEAVVVIPAGGFGFRMRGAVPGQEHVTQKSLLCGPNGESLIARVIRQYRDAGCRHFVALVNHSGEEVERHLEGGKPWGVTVRCSYDPDTGGSGRTGAMVRAVENGVLPADRLLLVHNADCQVIRYPGNFPHDLLAAHLRSVEARPHTRATLAAVDGTPYPFTGMEVREGRVTAVEMYPFIPVPTHTGITVITPAGLSEILQSHAGSRQNFERDMFPHWAANESLGAMVIPYRQWVAVDDGKAYRQYAEAVADEATT